MLGFEMPGPFHYLEAASTFSRRSCATATSRRFAAPSSGSTCGFPRSASRPVEVPAGGPASRPRGPAPHDVPPPLEIPQGWAGSIISSCQTRSPRPSSLAAPSRAAMSVFQRAKYGFTGGRLLDSLEDVLEPGPELRRRLSACAGRPSARSSTASHVRVVDLVVLFLRKSFRLDDLPGPDCLGVLRVERARMGRFRNLARRLSIEVSRRRPQVLLDRLRVVPHPLVGHGEVAVGLDEVGLDRQGTVEVLDGFVVAAGVRLDLAQLSKGLALSWAMNWYFFRFSIAFSYSPAVAVVVTDLVVRLGVVRVDRRSSSIDPDGLVGVALGHLVAGQDLGERDVLADTAGGARRDARPSSGASR